MKNKGIMLFGLVLMLLVAVGAASFIVDETEQVVITQFGRPVGNVITKPGIYFKIPFVQKANFFDKRYMEWDGDRAQVSTEEKQLIFVDITPIKQK